jgi:hypothetical protein
VGGRPGPGLELTPATVEDAYLLMLGDRALTEEGAVA